MSMKPRIAIIGAGPIGLEAALYGRLKGYEVTLYERGRIAENVRQWGHVRMFSPFGMNSSEWGRGAVEETGSPLPATDAILTGHDFSACYLHPIAWYPRLKSCIRMETECLAIVRRHQLKTERVGDPRRGDSPFTLLMRDKIGERTFEADVVLDCTGTFGNHNNLGLSGVICPGERENRSKIDYGLPVDATPSWCVQHWVSDAMVVGSGHSAATTILGLQQVREELPKFPLRRVYWVTRGTHHKPVPRIENDRLPERDQLAEAANNLATASGGLIEWISGAGVQSIDWDDHTGRLKVAIEWIDDSRTQVLEVDRIIANVGYRPDRSLYEELQVHECYATQGPMKLAAKLLGETSADCLDQTLYGPEVLRNPEPNFYILGMKSYGRRSNFLIQVGLQQIVDVFTLIEQDWGL